MSQRFLRHFFPAIAVVAAIVLWEKWPAVPVSAIGWFYVGSVAVGGAAFYAFISATWVQPRWPARPGLWHQFYLSLFVLIAAVATIVFIVIPLDLVFPDLRTVHFQRR